MVERGETEWENKLIARSTFAVLMEDLRRIGRQGLCIDPVKGDIGTKATFDEMDNLAVLPASDKTQNISTKAAVASGFDIPLLPVSCVLRPKKNRGRSN